MLGPIELLILLVIGFAVWQTVQGRARTVPAKSRGSGAIGPAGIMIAFLGSSLVFLLGGGLFLLQRYRSAAFVAVPADAAVPLPVAQTVPMGIPWVMILLGAMFLFGLIALGIVGLVAFTRRSSSSEPIFDDDEARHVTAKPSGMGWLWGVVALPIGLVVVGSLMLIPTRVVIQQQQAATIEEDRLLRNVVEAERQTQVAYERAVQRSQAELEAASQPNGPVSAMMVLNRPLVAEAGAEERPAWLTADPYRDSYVVRTIIKSAQYATLSDAQADADRQVVAILEQDLARFPQRFGELRHRATGQLDPRAPITERYVESMVRDFGSFQAPMYRQWYQIQLSPEQRAPSLELHRARLAEGRTVLAGSAVAGLVVLFGTVLVAGACRRAVGPGFGRLTDLGFFGLLFAGLIAGGVVLNQYVVLWPW
jgi:hypothetical protein